MVDLVLVIGLALVVWHRTPVGGLAQWAVAALWTGDADTPSLVATFDASRVVPFWATAPTEPALPDIRPTTDGLPEPYRRAVRTALAGSLPDAVSARLERAHPDLPAEERVLAYLDADVMANGDPHGALGRLAVGQEQWDRATARARTSPSQLQTATRLPSS